MPTGTEQDLDWSSRGLITASLPADRPQANQGVGKVPKPIPASLRDTPARKPGKVLPRMASRQNGVREQEIGPLSQENSKPQDLIDWNVSLVDILLRKLQWVYCPGHTGVKGNDRADTQAGKATLTSVLLLGSSEVLRILRHCKRAQSRGHHTIDRLDERGVERGSARRSS